MRQGFNSPDYWTIIPNYETLLQQLAKRIKNRSSMVAGLEIDDLMQEGRVAVWLAVEAGKNPSKDILHKRMLNYIRKMRGQGEMSWEHDEL